MGADGGKPRREVEEKVMKLSEDSFYIIPEDPEVPHISEEVVKAAVEEH